MRERAIRFGTNNALVGVLTEPAPGAAAEQPAIVFLNSGILHHVGASRLYVRLARRLAGQGFLCLRFDLSGIGDSEPRRDALGPVESALRDGADAMEYLAESHGARTFLLAGLCSGSDMAFHLALADPRVTGIINLDAWAYRTFRYYARRFGPKLFDASAWGHSIRVRLGRSGSDAETAESDMFVPPEYRRIFPPRAEVESGLKRLLDRGLRLFHFFSGGMESHINHAAQYERAFSSVEFGDRLCVIYRPEADHTLTSLDDQSFVIDAISEWVTSNYAPTTGNEVPSR